MAARIGLSEMALRLCLQASNGSARVDETVCSTNKLFRRQLHYSGSSRVEFGDRGRRG